MDEQPNTPTENKLGMQPKPKTLAPTNAGIGKNVYLKSRHFIFMVLGALIFHGIVFAGIGLWPKEEVVEVPVRTLSLKLGGGPTFDAGPNGPLTGDVLPEALPDSGMPDPAMPNEAPQQRIENPVLEALEEMEVPEEPVAGVADKPNPPKVSAPKTQNFAALITGDVDFPNSNQKPKSKPKAESKPKPAPKKAAPKPAPKKKEAPKKEVKKKEPEITEDPFAAPKEPVKEEKLPAPPKQVNKPKPKSYKIMSRQKPQQNPIPAPTSSQAVRLPNVAPSAPSMTGRMANTTPAPAIAPKPTQYVRTTPVAGQGEMQMASHAPAGMGMPQGTILGSGADGLAFEEEIRRRYEQTISQWIAKHKVYPAGALLLGQQGKVIMRVRIDRAGNVRYSAVEKSSGYKLIDRAAIDMVRRANPVPAAPANYPAGALLEFLIPARFDLQ